MLSEDQDDVDDEERVDVVGDVAPGSAASAITPRILSSEARTAASKASRAPSRSSASSPASVLPPGEATARRTSAGWRSRSSSAVPAVVSTTSSRASSASSPAAAPASAIASTASAR